MSKYKCTKCGYEAGRSGFEDYWSEDMYGNDVAVVRCPECGRTVREDVAFPDDCGDCGDCGDWDAENAQERRREDMMDYMCANGNLDAFWEDDAWLGGRW